MQAEESTWAGGHLQGPLSRIQHLVLQLPHAACKVPQASATLSERTEYYKHQDIIPKHPMSCVILSAGQLMPQKQQVTQRQHVSKAL